MPLRIQAGARHGGAAILDRDRDDRRVRARSGLAARRRVLQVALGVIWLLDAALQFQPYMFTRAFVRDVILSTAPGNPAIVARPIIWAANLMLGHVVVANSTFATLQLALALGLFWRPAVRIALAASIAWSLAVWWLGEGFGGVLTGSLDPFGGAPGAAILYVVVALLAWPRPESEPDPHVGCVAETSPLGRFGAMTLWTVLWAGLGCAALLPATRSAHGTYLVAVLAALCGVAAVAVASGRLARLGVVAAVVAGAAIWVVQDFGELLTGQATDPNSGPLLILIAAAFWPVARGLR
ncbi:MAG: hypothetical protein ACTHKL_17305 [Streptosporangiaceae bacterium]